MANALHRLGRFAVRRRRLVLGTWILALVAALGLAVASGGAFADDFEIPGTESQAAYDLLADRFPEHAGTRAQVVVHVPDGTLDEPARAAAIAEVQDHVARLPHVSGPPVLLLAPEGSPSAGRTGLIEVGYDLDMTELGTAALHELEATVEPLHDAGIAVVVGGELAQYAEQPETETAEMLGILAATVILLFAFGSVIAMGLPIGIALFGLVTGTTLVLLLASVVSIPAAAPTLSTMIGIGVGIDYALFVVTRHRQHLAEGMTVADAAGRANATAGQAVIFAGGTVVIAICGLALAGIPLVAAMGYAAAVVVAVMVLASITLLPALFGFAGLRLLRTSLPWVRRREARQAARAARLERLGAAAPRTGWQRWGDHVTARPWRYLLGGSAVLVLLSLPVLDMRLGQTDAGNAHRAPRCGSPTTWWPRGSARATTAGCWWPWTSPGPRTPACWARSGRSSPRTPGRGRAPSRCPTRPATRAWSWSPRRALRRPRRPATWSTGCAIGPSPTRSRARARSLTWVASPPPSSTSPTGWGSGSRGSSAPWSGSASCC
jgi:putative drug exporter of the RND superfamily